MTRYITRITTHDSEDAYFARDSIVPQIPGLTWLGVNDKSRDRILTDGTYVELEVLLLAEGEEPLHTLAAMLGFDSDSVAENFDLEELQA